MPILSRNVDQKSIETVFLIAICCPTGDKWQLKTLFLSIFYPCLAIVDYIFDCRLPGVSKAKLNYHLYLFKSRSKDHKVQGQKACLYTEPKF